MDDSMAGSGGGRLKVLVVDDEPVIRMLVQATLSQDERYDLLVAEDGVQAVEIAQAERPDLIILDVRMPHMTGFEACRALREDPATANVHIVMLTAMGQDTDIEQGYAAGADDYFLKPFLPDELLDKVRSTLRLAAWPAWASTLLVSEPATRYGGRRSRGR